ncbi:MAG: helix-turn-helix transcriptional regulator [Ignavibacteriae bacterium]|nr:helix-turn-helix transcriptional regulator [Ignavibacteria bacterium]MBI3365948.1 helix-turn-helix transcriptional regulator [Ignavibacteriota bacterium]
MIPATLQFLGFDPSALQAKTLGERLFIYRKSHGITQRKLAMQIGVDPTSLNRCERGKN